ncbi:hypothetical protein HYU15_01350 [Candidatus Woesearchaeota archaeon]|nr:hypothetical protein [Candidatus Woesearchaeota archaeon]
MKIMFFAVNGRFGHIMRTLNVMSAIKVLDDSLELCFSTSCRFMSWFGLNDALLRILPDPAKGISMFIEGFKSLITSYKPNIIVYDDAPAGIAGFAKSSNIKNILVLRKYDNTTLKHFVSTHMRNFDIVLMPHYEQEIKSLVPQELYSKLKASGKVRFVGPIVRQVRAGMVSRIREKYDIRSSNFNILVTFGAGGYESNESLLLKALRRCEKAIPNMRAYVVTGPYCKRRPSHRSFRITDFEPNIPEFMSIADLVITHGGYNSTNEVIEAKTPSIIIPRQDNFRIYPERQLDNAMKIEEHGLGIVLRSCFHMELSEAIMKFYSDKGFYRRTKENLERYRLEKGNFTAGSTIVELALMLSKAAFGDLSVNAQTLAAPQQSQR